jgi:pSer/pThr/pTyr-binding forkhead associated (FHA) protein
MDVRLKVEQGRTTTRVIHLRAPESVVGRAKGCGVRIPSAEVSRRHCALRVRDGYLTVEDLNSSNGTYLNGAAVSGRQVVRPGDRLRIGPLTFRVEYQLTPEAIDRLLRGEGAADVAEVEPLEEVEAVEELRPTEVEEDLPMLEVEEDVETEEVVSAVDAEEVLGNAEGWQMPESEDLRDLLTGLEDDDEPPPGKRRRT